MQVLKKILFILVTSQVIYSAHGIRVFNETSCLHSKSSSSSVLRPMWESVFKRKRRFILFPKGGTLKFTVFVSKGFLSLYPRGLNFLIEAAFYYPGPWQRIDLIPKPLRSAVASEPQALSPSKTTYVYIPASEIRFKAKSVGKPQQIKRIDGSGNQFHSPSHSNYYTKYEKSHLWDSYTYGNMSRNRQTTFWDSAKHKNRKRKYQHSRTSILPERKSTRYQENIHKNQQSILDPYKSMKFTKDYHSHRDRRQFFHNFEGFSNIVKFDMKLCILRAICDAKKLLLPKGYSLIHDTLRLLFTFPTTSATEDEYSRIMKADFKSCDEQLRSKCSVSLLDWFGNIATFK